MYLHVYMLDLGGQTDGQNWLNLFEGTHGYPKDKIGLKTIQLLIDINSAYP